MTSAYVPATSNQYAYRDGIRPLDGLYKWLRLSLIVFIFAEIGLTLGSVGLALSGGLAATEISDSALMLLAGVGIVGIFYLILLIICIILTARWTYRAMKNLHTVGEKMAEMSPGWAVGWYFIPIANLWKPAEGMSQIYHGSANALHEKSARNSPISGWWMSWLFMGFIGNASSRIPDYNQATMVLDTVSGVLSITACVLLLKITRVTTDRQKQLVLGGAANVFD